MARWNVLPREDLDLLTHLCLVRGLTKEQLSPNYETQLHSPFLLPSIKEAIKLIKIAKEKKWFVTIFGDYDADGTPAAALLSTAFKRLGISHQVILPTRQEGYGLNLKQVEKIATLSQLLITVDTGITAIEEIGYCKKKGVHVIVLDHHLPKETLPPADALIDPFLATSTYPFNHLCGCALAFKFVEALASEFPVELTEGFRKWLLDLVAISTVADMMVMRDENRTLVHYGLQILRKNRRPGVRALLAGAGINADDINAGTLGFAIGPRLNASGRMGDNRPAFDLLMAEDEADAVKLAEVIEQTNRQRQQSVEKSLKSARSVVWQQNSIDDHCLIVTLDDAPAGVLGLVAGKLASEHYRPSVVLSKGAGELFSGSARSVGNYSIIDGLDASSKWLSRFGGHRQAAGLAVKPNMLKPFIDSLKAHANATIDPSELIPLLTADAQLEETELNLDTALMCEQLAPFGLENPQPLFMIQDITLTQPKILGVTGTHIKWRAQKGDKEFEVIGFGMAARANKEKLSNVDLLGHLECNRWNNQSRLQLRVADFRPAGQKMELDQPVSKATIKPNGQAKN